MNAVHTAELYTEQRVRWEKLCCRYFTTIKKKNKILSYRLLTSRTQGTALMTGLACDGRVPVEWGPEQGLRLLSKLQRPS